MPKSSFSGVIALPLTAVILTYFFILNIQIDAVTGHGVGPPKRHRPRFTAGPWKNAKATFYEGNDLGGACGYKTTEQGYGHLTAALSQALYNDGQCCGACYEIKCVNCPEWCKPGKSSIIVTATDHCPSGSSGGWCNPPNEHFDLNKPAFLEIAEEKGGVVPVEYRRVPCPKQGGIKFTISGNPWYLEVRVWNVGGAGDVKCVLVKGSKNGEWITMKRSWGQVWTADTMLVGESISFRVIASDVRSSTSWHVAPANWQFGQTFEGKNFR